MAAKNKYFVIGTAVMTTIIAALIIVSIIAEPNFFRPKVKAETLFSESVNGLSVGAPVKFRGVPVGEVTAIELSSRAYPQQHIFLLSKNESLADVKMTLYMKQSDFQKHIKQYIKEGLRAQTQLSGLTGTLYVSLEFLNPQEFPDVAPPKNWDSKSFYIPSAPSLTTQIALSVDTFLSRLDRLHINGSFPNTRLFIENLDRIAEGIKGESINILLTNANKLLQTTSNKISDFDVKALDNLINQLNSSAKSMDKQLSSTKVSSLVRDINKLSTKFNNMAQNNRYDIRALMLSLLSVTQNLELITSELANDPSSFFRRKAQQKVLGK